MFSIQVDGQQEVVARFTSMPSKLHAALTKKIWTLAIELATRVRKKLSGEVLQVRTGALRASINEDVQTTTNSVVARVYSSGDVKYAGIHEFGGVIPAHDTVPNKAKALAFIMGGKQVFAKRVHIPDVHMPERSFLRSSLAEMKDQIIQGMRDAARDGL
jgi:phage gpG-like protein